jgi:hypothetical protein
MAHHISKALSLVPVLHLLLLPGSFRFTEVEVYAFHQPFPKLYLLRLFELLRYLRYLTAAKQFKIFLKSLIDFSSYMLPFAIISVIFVLTSTSISLQYISRQAYAWPFHEQTRDLFWYYLIGSIRLYFCSNSGTLMYRAAVLDSPGWTVFFVLQSLAAKYLIENLFLTIYISIYSRLILHHATKQAAIILDFEKSAHQKREMVEKSIFRGASDRRKQLFRERQQAEIEARSSLLKEMKGLRIMRGTEGRRLFTNALNSVLKTSKRKQRSDSVTPPTISIAGFSYRDPDTPNRRISSLANRRKNRLISQLMGAQSNDSFSKRLALPLPEIPETNLMSERNENLPTVETPRGADQPSTLLNIRGNHLSRTFQSPARQLSQANLSSDVSGSHTLMNRTRSSNLSLIFPHGKGRLLRKLSMVKGVGRVEKPSAFITWFGTPTFLTVSTIAAVVLSVITTLSLKPLACSGWQGFYPMFSIFWLCNLYFGFELTVLVIFPY